MSRLLRILLVFLILAVPFVARCQPTGSPAGGIERRIDSLMAKMTLEEKIGQLTQYSPTVEQSGGKSALSPAQLALVREGKVGSYLNVTGATLTREIQRTAITESRLKIPIMFGLDVIHGFRTVFPIPLGEASTWEPDLIRKAARTAALEATAAGIHWTFGPMVDIARDPRWGRIAEGSGEDPYLGSLMAVACVQGFQGDDLALTTSMVACPKHFAAYGGAEGGRDYNVVDISERTLREIYLPPFESAVRAGAGTIMCSFNEIAGTPSTANRQLLTDILRGEWGFDGFVVSDWGSIGELQAHGVASSLAEAASLAITAGTDMDMESKAYPTHLADLVKSGTVAERTVDDAVRRVLRIKYRLGLFDDPYHGCSVEREQTEILSAAHRALARDVARRSIVLLKNASNTLPLRKDSRTIAVIGPLAESRKDPLGPWDAMGRSEDVVSVLDGIRKSAGPRTTVLYAKGCEIDSTATAGFSAAIDAASRADAVVLVVGESSSMSGEAASRSSLALPGNQEDFVKAVAATGKPVVVVLLNGRPLAIPWIAEHIPAILEAWFPGVETGNAVADVIFGEYNPSGKLPVTFPRTVGQVPIYYNHKNTGRPGDARERFTSRYIDLPLTPLFPFGYGLSYTTFACGKPVLTPSEITGSDSVIVSVELSNRGDRAGEEVVQVYVRDDVASVTRSVKELKAFQKVALKPGETKRVSFTIPARALAMESREMKRVVEPGSFTVFVGTNSDETQSTTFTVVGGAAVR